MMDLDLRRRFFAEELEAVSKLRSPLLVDAFAAVPRERFLPPGPWHVWSDSFEIIMGRARSPHAADGGCRPGARVSQHLGGARSGESEDQRAARNARRLAGRARPR